jgi:hypothetical protein
MVLIRLLCIGFAAVCLLGLSMCSDPVSPEPSYDFSYPDPIDSAATDISLTICHGEAQDTLDIQQVSGEGSITISALQPDPGPLAVYASADGFYTEVYCCTTNAEIDVDLDAVPQAPNALTATLFYLHRVDTIAAYWEVSYLSDYNLPFTGPPDVSSTVTTDDQGRFGLGNLTRGTFSFSTSHPVLPQAFDLENTSTTDYHDLYFKREDHQVDAPNIYLYPEVHGDVSVILSFPSGSYVTQSQPPYEDGWNVSVTPDGMIDGHYGYLFYEAVVPVPINLETAWLLDGTDLENELRELLEGLGFVEREIDDFIDFWIPRLGSAPWYALYPQNPELMSTLNISPAPDNVLRALFYIRAMESRPSIPTPSDPGPFVRGGFTVVEWGVIGWGE